MPRTRLELEESDMLPPLDIRTCAHCGRRYSFFRLYCKQCGCVMPGALSGQNDVTRLLTDNPVNKVDFQWGRTYFHRYARLLLRDEATDDVVLVPLDTPHVIIGRASPNYTPTVTFPGRVAEVSGISRSHACLELRGSRLLLTDLGSTNGTYLDGEWLTPQVAYLLHNRAALQIGKLLLRVQFA